SKWQIIWYQSLLPGQNLLQYYADEGAEGVKTVRYDTKAGMSTSLNLSNTAERTIYNFGYDGWQISPDREWLIGFLDDANRLVLEINGSKRFQKAMFAVNARWMPDSRGWIEWTYQNDTTVARNKYLTDDPTRNENP